MNSSVPFSDNFVFGPILVFVLLILKAKIMSSYLLIYFNVIYVYAAP